MASRITAMQESLAWKQAYMAAIRSKEKEQLYARIASAMELLGFREHHLMQYLAASSRTAVDLFDVMEELEAISDATYLLKAYYEAQRYRDVPGEWTAEASAA